MNGSNEIYNKKRETQKRREEKDPKKKKKKLMAKSLVAELALLVFPTKTFKSPSPTIELNKKKKKFSPIRYLHKTDINCMSNRRVACHLQ